MRKNIDLSDEAVKALSIQAIENGRKEKIKNYSHKSLIGAVRPLTSVSGRITSLIISVEFFALDK